MARCFYLAAIATIRPRFGLDAAVHRSHAVHLVYIAPQHHCAAIAPPGGIGLDARTLRHRHLRGLACVAAALPVATHQHRAAACGAIRIHLAGPS